ncbi:MAG: D-alanyl-D-alanine carboxypeptidase/D-alanyl-D-alanine-endopeptidase [Opitutae bacterium]|nr:D-alanyl-D-alanine carboxypeptidase/D-alanyl-D-alanine-endopeptidase [Opitutae bacterium]
MTLLPRLLLVLVAFASSALLRAAALSEEMAAFLAQPRFDGAMWGVEVVSLDSGQTLFAHQPHLRLSPASNAKLYVGALALARLGGDYRIRTPLLATAAVTAAGELPGDLVVAGRGDPSWGAREKKPAFPSVFAPFVEALRHAGVKRIRGDVVADGTWLRQPPDGAGWTVDDMNFDYGTEISGITLFDNFVELRVTPGAKPGEPCAFEVLEPLSGLTFVNHTRTLAAGATATVETRRNAGTTVVEIIGGVAVDAKSAKTEAPVPRPAQWFAVALKAALERAGIRVDGEARSLVWPETPARAGVRLGEIVSPPLRELVAGFMKPSQNLETDLVFGHLGESRRTADTPAEKRSDDLALDALKEFAREVGIAPNDLVFEEGSGLSRNNLTTADATTRLLAFMAKHRETDAFLASLPIAGVDGSLHRRMKGTAAENNVRAKTGGLRWAASLSGYATLGTGERVAFSFMLNRHVAAEGRRAWKEIDDLTVILAHHGHP